MTKTLILILYILGLGMILLGFMTADKILLPPIVTGLGFLVIGYTQWRILEGKE